MSLDAADLQQIEQIVSRALPCKDHSGHEKAILGLEADNEENKASIKKLFDRFWSVAVMIILQLAQIVIFLLNNKPKK